MDLNNKTSNMTEGSIFRLLLLFFMPIFLGNLFQQAYSMVDSVIVGKGIGDDALAAVGATGLINFLLLGFIFGLTGGFGIHMSQSFGAGDFRRLRGQIGVALILSVVIGAVSTIACLCVIRPVFLLVDTPLDILEDALAYFRIILYGILISLLCNLAYTILRAVGNSRTPLIATVVSSVINIVLDYILVIPFRMGVEGAAIATVVSQLIAGLICLRTILKIDELRLKKEDFCFSWKVAGALLGTGFPVAIMNAITAGGCLILQTIVNRMGSDYVAAYAACMKILTLFEQSSIAVGMTMLTFVGQNLGAGKIERIRTGVRKGVLMATIVNIPLALAEIFIPGLLVSIMLNGTEPIAYSAQFLPITGVGLFALGYLYVYRCSLQGLGNTVLPMFSGLIEVLMRLIFGVTVGVLSYRGIALSEVAAWVGAWLFLMGSYWYVLRKKSKAVAV